ncbi:NADH:flavin oxidoreductase [Desulfosporosinus orientis DSM 765]|uniref:NADH:flavin oxidoreductase n=1 Tax=Desulfosporosinus orientis (strain ATCC 19365 / DSM 765 / NCIMB 8382 / VKM B-1628 / Singapore I) TaxID=768706 RepID=G7WF59_DESOD|nr:NADH:flavin oxidoreductase [Desulfosporosinus orientis]AET67670.1 NADH:flavin oxidoreductase [Desulfosporosinus orientis DSM 765]
MEVFEWARLGSCSLKNRIIRSATFEGMCDSQGRPLPEYQQLYGSLARGGVAGIITGFAYICQEGKAMQPGQAGMDREELIDFYWPVTEEVHQFDCKIFLQLAHTGRQTRRLETGYEVVGASSKPSAYFGGSPRNLSTNEVYSLVKQFGKAAYYAKASGFDGVQVHAAHGYLIHQFLLPSLNQRQDEFGISKKGSLGTKFLELVLQEIRNTCGEDFALLVKISGSDDYFLKFTMEQFAGLISFLDRQKVDGIEISYGTMDYPLNIFRGDIPLKVILKHNPIFKTNQEKTIFRVLRNLLIYPMMRAKLKPFTPCYNLDFARKAKTLTDIPIISVGGFRRGSEIYECLENGLADFVSLCRPFLCEPDFVNKLQEEKTYISQCINCNICAVMCDSKQKTRCYR